jgi:type IV pilus assembly protein PilB
MARTLRQRVLDALIERELVSLTQLDQVLKIHKQTGETISRILISQNMVEETLLLEVLSEESKIPPIHIEHFSIPPDLIHLIPKQIAEQYGVIPVSKIGNVLTVAMSDPLNILMMDDLKKITGLDIHPVLGSEQDLKNAYQSYYEKAGSEVIEELMEGVQKDRIELLSADESTETGSSKLAVEQSSVVKITNLIFTESIRLHSSDILIEPFENMLKVRYRIDGVLREIDSPPHHLHSAIVGRIKILSKLDISEHRLPQDGRFKIKFRSRNVDFRVSIVPSSYGEKICLRVLDHSAGVLGLDELGYEKECLRDLKKTVKQPHGLILICGPTGSGKSSTLYSCLRYLDSIEKNIVTVEDPVEYEFDGINQVNVRDEIKFSFSKALRSILRQDPDIMMIGEIRDLETVDIAIKSALTGHLVLSTLHTNDSTSTIVRLMNMGVEAFLISSALVFVMAQRLVRRLCPTCRRPYEMDVEELRKMGMGEAGVKKSKKQILYRSQGCVECANTGYKGRLVVGEALEMSAEIRNMVIQGKTEVQMRRHARRAGMKTLRENGIQKALSGETSLEEVLRLTAPEERLNGQIS